MHIFLAPKANKDLSAGARQCGAEPVFRLGFYTNCWCDFAIRFIVCAVCVKAILVLSTNDLSDCYVDAFLTAFEQLSHNIKSSSKILLYDWITRHPISWQKAWHPVEI